MGPSVVTGSWKDCVKVTALYLRACKVSGDDLAGPTAVMTDCLLTACRQAPRDEKPGMFDEFKRVAIPFDICYKVMA